MTECNFVLESPLPDDHVRPDLDRTVRQVAFVSPPLAGSACNGSQAYSVFLAKEREHAPHDLNGRGVDRERQ